MKNIFIIALSVLGFSTFAVEEMPRVTSAPILTCKSIDVTHTPFYTIQVWPARSTSRTFRVLVYIRNGVGEPQTQSDFAAKGSFSKDAFNVKLEDGSVLTGKRLANGFLKGQYDHDDESEELSCKIQNQGR
jgi:hypothetical protein